MEFSKDIFLELTYPCSEVELGRTSEIIGQLGEQKSSWTAV